MEETAKILFLNFNASEGVSTKLNNRISPGSQKPWVTMNE